MNYLSFGYGEKLLAASTSKGLNLYSNFDEGDATLDQIFEDGSSINTHDISKDGTYIVLGSSSLKVYMNDAYEKCNISYCTKCLNSTFCEHCNELLNYYYSEVREACIKCD